MKLLLQVVSWVSIVIGALALVGTLTAPADADTSFALVGSLLFLSQGIVALLYIKEVEG